MKENILIILGGLCLVLLLSLNVHALSESADPEAFPENPQPHFAVSSPGYYPGYIFGYDKDLHQIRNYTAPSQVGSFGTAFVFTDDVDGDAAPDLFVAAPYAYHPLKSGVFLMSSRTGQLLWKHLGDSRQGIVYREVVDTIEDIDRDGLRDLIFTSARSGTSAPGQVVAHSARTKEFLFKRIGNSGDYFGKAVGTTSDFDGDGFDDLLISAPYLENYRGSVTLLSTLYHQSPLVFGSFKWSTSGIKTGEQFGYELVAFDDVDEDGITEVLIGSPSYNGLAGTGSGKVTILSGKKGTTLEIVEGDQAQSHFGQAITVLDDIDSDGTKEFLVGAEQYDGVAGSQTGKVTLYSGDSKSVLWSLEGIQSTERFGQAVTVLDDISGDTVLDFLIGAPGGGTNASGRIYAYSGATQQPLWSLDGGSLGGTEFGSALARVYDLDKDGVDDFVVGASTDGAGRVDAYSGATHALLWRVYGEEADDLFGVSLSLVGDVNADGIRDVLVGAEKANTLVYNNAGKVYVLSGVDGSVLLTLEGQHNNARFGHDVSALPVGRLGGKRLNILVGAPDARDISGQRRGVVYAYALNGSLIWSETGISKDVEFGSAVLTGYDVTGDTIEDIIVGAQEDNAGSVSLYVGAVTEEIIWNEDGDHGGDKFGTALAVGGDVTGEGIDDIAVGAPWGGSVTDGIFVYSGESGGLVWSLTPFGTTAGVALSFIHDVDGDGRDELIVGDHLYSLPETSNRGYSGRVTVHSGRDGSVLWNQVGEEGGSQLGRSVAVVPDVNNDGIDEVLVGAPEFGNTCGAVSSSCALNRGKAYLYSGVDGQLLWSQEGLGPSAQMGYAVRAVRNP